MRAAPWGEERDGCVGEEGGKRKVAARGGRERGGWKTRQKTRQGAGTDGEIDGGKLGGE